MAPITGTEGLKIKRRNRHSPSAQCRVSLLSATGGWVAKDSTFPGGRGRLPSSSVMVETAKHPHHHFARESKNRSLRTVPGTKRAGWRLAQSTPGGGGSHHHPGQNLQKCAISRVLGTFVDCRLNYSFSISASCDLQQ